MMLEGQAFDVEVTGDEFSECRLKLFEVIIQDHREAFKQTSCPKPDHGCFLCGQMLDFLHRLLRRIVERDILRDETDWEALRQYDFTSTEMLDVPTFMEQSDFRAKIMRVAESKINVERKKSKRQKTSEAVECSVIGATFNPFIDTGRTYIRSVAKELMKHPAFKSDLVMGMACFAFSTLFVLPRLQAFECFGHLFQVPWVVGNGIQKNVHMDDYVEFINQFQNAKIILSK